MVTRVAITDRGDPTKYVAFVIFKDGSCALSNDEAIAEAKSIVAAMPLGKGTDIDYTGFYIGDGEDGTSYYFDVCLYEGAFDVPVGTANTTMGNVVVTAGNPVIMADLSPQNGVMLTHEVKRKLRSVYNRRQAQ